MAMLDTLRALAKLLFCAGCYYVGLTGLVARWFPRRRPVILCAHRVVSRDDPFFPGVRAERFAAEVAYLARHHRVLPLADIVEATLGGRELPRGAVAITFDDGFADNFELAYPVLRRHRLPATIFLVVESVETGRLPWPERVADLLRRTPRTRLALDVPEPRVFSLRTEAERLDALAAIVPRLKACDTEVRRRALDELEASLSVGPDSGTMLTWNQCRRMAGAGIGFGGHTLSHPILPRTSAVEIKHEIAASKAAIEARLNDRVRYFAYPNNERCPAAVDAVEAAGFDAAFTGPDDVDRTPVDRFAIGRSAWTLDPVAVFAAEVSGLLEGPRWLTSRLRGLCR